MESPTVESPIMEPPTMESPTIMKSAADDGGVKLRTYQHEMLEASMKRNVIVAMDTGSGKTHIAIARMRRELENAECPKTIWFLTPSVALAMQQQKAISAELPAYRTISLTGLDNVDKWTDQKLWDATLNNVDVVVATPAVLLDALTHAFVSITSISLLVFDEAHHATKKHPMNTINMQFIDPAQKRGLKVPAILGLTASPVVNSKHGSLEMLEANLHAISVTPKTHRAELERHVNAPRVEVVLYSADVPAISDNVCSALAREARSYDVNTDPYVLDLRERDDPKATKELISVMNKRKTYSLEQIRALDLRASTLETELGPSIASWYVSTCIDRFSEGIASESTVLPDLSERERSHLASILLRVKGHSVSDFQEALDTSCITEKAQKLVQVLQKSASPSLRGIIFVEQRVHVTALTELLRRLPEVRNSYKIASFVGTSTSSKRKGSLADLVDIRDQQADLDAFRSGTKNLMICTSVLEEGIDVSSCNLVVCFEIPKNLVSFVQRRGRARKNDSKYVLFVSQDDHKRQNRPWEALEARMKELYMDDTRQLNERVDEDPDPGDRLYRVDATGAILTLDNAKAHLYHFCSVGTMHASNYIDLRPEFDTVQDPTTELWTAVVDLPSFVHISVRHASSARAWKTEDQAVKDAAFEAYVKLHKNCLINDNLLPLTKEYGPETGQHYDQPSIVCVSDRKLSLAVSYEGGINEHSWYNTSLSISLVEEKLVEMDVWTPFQPPKLEDIVLYWNREVTYTVQFTRPTTTRLSMDREQLRLLRATTKVLLSSVHASRMASEADDFLVLFAPSAVADLGTWLQEVHGNRTASEFIAAGTLEQAGVVRVSSQAGRTFFLDAKNGNLSSGVQHDQLVVLSFPKRRDFLHPVTSDAGTNAAYTTAQSFSLSDCTIDLLPAKYALFAAFAPSIIHRMDTALSAAELNNTVLQNVGISNVSLVLEAISAPATGEMHDYNRLEYLGDTCLKHCTELQVMAQHPTWPESYLTLERDRMVRNTNLAKAAMDLGLDKYILTTQFTGSKWRPLYVSEIVSNEPKQRQISTKTLADVVEALIGAAFVDGGKIEQALLCIQTLLPTETWFSPRHCFDVMIGELRPCEVNNLSLLEQVVGHTFTNKTLLIEALTHVSFPYNKTGLSLERLEFLGDSVLDMLVTPKLFAHARNLRHDQMHGIHEALVNSAFLGHLCMSYEVEQAMEQVVLSGDSCEIEVSVRKLHLYDLLRCGSQLLPLKQKSLAAFEQLHAEIDEALANSKEYPWPALVAERPQKFFCDLVESILGALFVDSRGDMSVCEAFADRLGIFKHMKRILNDHVDTLSPKERMGILADRDAVRYENSRSEKDNGGRTFACTVIVGDESVATVGDCGSKEEAEVKAAYKACKLLEARGTSRRRKRKVHVAGLSSENDGEAMGIEESSTVGATEVE